MINWALRNKEITAAFITGVVGLIAAIVAAYIMAPPGRNSGAEITSTTAIATPRVELTSTLMPTPLDPLSAAKQWPSTFSDSFNNTLNDWPALSDTEGAVKVTTDLAFKVAVVTGGKVQSAKYQNIKSQLGEDFLLSVEVVAKQQTGCYYGLLFRVDEAKDYYWFQVRHGNKYKLEQRLAGNYADIIPEKSIRSDIEVSSLTVLGKGDMYELYVNDQLIDTFQSNLIKGNQAGIATVTCQFLESAEYIFDNFQIRSLNPTSSLPLTTNIITDFTAVANRSWQNSGLKLAPGNKVSVKYIDGQWRVSPKNEYTDAGGYKKVVEDLHVPGAKYSALLARVGDNGKPFEVGMDLEFTASESGYLFFQINDGLLDDNDGSVKVKINLTQ